jgi:hypothetical protein
MQLIEPADDLLAGRRGEHGPRAVVERGASRSDCPVHVLAAALGGPAH